MWKVLDDKRVRDGGTLRWHFQSISRGFPQKKEKEDASLFFAGCTRVIMQVLFQLLNSGIGLESWSRGSSHCDWQLKAS